jgi:hypothetical protein
MIRGIQLRGVLAVALLACLCAATVSRYGHAANRAAAEHVQYSQAPAALETPSQSFRSFTMLLQSIICSISGYMCVSSCQCLHTCHNQAVPCTVGCTAGAPAAHSSQPIAGHLICAAVCVFLQGSIHSKPRAKPTLAVPFCCFLHDLQAIQAAQTRGLLVSCCVCPLKQTGETSRHST